MSMTIFDRTGKPITPIRAENERSWVLNSEGKCTFKFALTDPKARQFILNAGNYIYIEHETLPAWGGVIDGDQDWEEDGTLSLTAWSAEHLLKFRRSPVNQTINAASAGALIKKLVDYANADEDLLIRMGAIYDGGGSRRDTLDGKSIYTHVESVANNAGVDWSVDPALDENGYLYFLMNVYQRRGVESGMALREGHNISRRAKPLKVRMGEIVNDLLGLGDASTNDRPAYIATDSASKSQYGLRQSTEDFDGVTDVGTLKANTIESVKVKAQPTRIHQVEALDVGRTFAELRLGNTHPLQAHTYGFLNDGRVGVDTRVRVWGMRYSEKTEGVEITSFEELDT